MILNLDNNDINVVMQTLEQGPFRLVAPVIMKIQAQVMAQQASAKPETADTAEVIPAGGTD